MGTAYKTHCALQKSDCEHGKLAVTTSKKYSKIF